MGAVPQSYDADIAAFVVDANCDKLVQSLDPVLFALKLVFRRLISQQQALDTIFDRAKTRVDRNLAFLNMVKSSTESTWFSSLLKAFGDGRNTEHLKELLQKSELL